MLNSVELFSVPGWGKSDDATSCRQTKMERVQPERRDEDILEISVPSSLLISTQIKVKDSALVTGCCLPAVDGLKTLSSPSSKNSPNMRRLPSLHSSPTCHAHVYQTSFPQHCKKRKLLHKALPTHAKSKGSEDTQQYITAGPADSPPDYTNIDAKPLNRVITQLFRRKMVAQLGVDSTQQGCLCQPPRRHPLGLLRKFTLPRDSLESLPSRVTGGTL